MTLLQKIMSIYGTTELNLPVVHAAAAMNWFYRKPHGGQRNLQVALDAIEVCGELVIKEALSAVEKEIGPGWRPMVINFCEGELTFLPVPNRMVTSVLESFHHQPA